MLADGSAVVRADEATIRNGHQPVKQRLGSGCLGRTGSESYVPRESWPYCQLNGRYSRSFARDTMTRRVTAGLLRVRQPGAQVCCVRRAPRSVLFDEPSPPLVAAELVSDGPARWQGAINVAMRHGPLPRLLFQPITGACSELRLALGACLSSAPDGVGPSGEFDDLVDHQEACRTATARPSQTVKLPTWPALTQVTQRAGLTVRQPVLEAGKLLFHVEAGRSDGGREPGGLLPGRLAGKPSGLPGRLDRRMGAALLTLLTALLTALTGALGLLHPLDRGEERSGDQQANADQVQDVRHRRDHDEDDHDSDGDSDYLEPAHRRPPPLTRSNPDGPCIPSELTSSKHWPNLLREARISSATGR